MKVRGGWPISGWLQSRASPSREVEPSPILVTGLSGIPENQRIYAIGDIHGRFDLAFRLLEAIRNELRVLTSPIEAMVITLGDLIDRGPQSRQVVELMHLMRDDPLFRFQALKGNHEAMFLATLDGQGTMWNEWLDFGGSETLLSYGIEAPRTKSPRLLRQSVARQIPVEDILFLQGLPSAISVGDYFFCHAGARPGVPLAQQNENDLLWIRRGFSDIDHGFEKIIVHGHTPVPVAEIRRHRINIDTGAYESGRLSAVVLEGKSIRILECNNGIEEHRT